MITLTSTTPLGALTTKLDVWLDNLVGMLPNAVAAVLVMLAFGYASRYVQRMTTRLVSRLSRNRAISNLLGTIARVGTVTLGAFVALSLLELDKAVTSLLAGVGVVGLALGFAFQDIAANFMSGVLMALRRPFDVGDLVEVDEVRGEVEQIELRATLLTTMDGLSVIVPNKRVFQNRIVNYTRTQERRVDLAVGVAYSDDLRAARAAAIEAPADLELRDPDREIEHYYTGFGDSAINFELRFWLREPDQNSYLRARSEAVIRVKEALDAHGFTIPFPIRTLDFGAASVGGRRVDEMKLRVVETSADA